MSISRLSPTSHPAACAGRFDVAVRTVDCRAAAKAFTCKLRKAKPQPKHACRKAGLRLDVVQQSQVRMRAVKVDAAASGKDLVIVGPGVLGSYLGVLWKQEHPSAAVIGQTNTTNNHDRLEHLGLLPRTKTETGSQQYPFVVFAAPPSGSTDYPGEVKQSLQLWDGTGTFLFTSSIGVYNVKDGSQCTEGSPLAREGDSPRTDRLLASERVVLEAGGCVVRLVGLYHAQRGAHTFFLSKGTVPRWGGYLVNLIHYEDAARICHAILRGDGREGQFYRSQAFVGTDGQPLTLQEMVHATLQSGQYRGSIQLVGEEDADKGKVVNNEETRRMLGGWQPVYPSFVDFMLNRGAKDWYTQQDLVQLGAAHQ